jgi:hypothetical protein
MITSILLAALLGLGLYIASHRLTGVQVLIAFISLAIGCALIVSPNLASQLATIMHVGRGSDLVIYFAIVGGLFVAANYFFRFKRQEQALVRTVRALALLESRTLHVQSAEADQSKKS